MPLFSSEVSGNWERADPGLTTSDGKCPVGWGKGWWLPATSPNILPLTKQKIRTSGLRHSREVWSWQLPPRTMSWHWIVCNHRQLLFQFGLNQLVRAWEMRRGLWMCRFRLDNFRAPKCIPATQVLNQMLCPSVFREKLKKKKKVANWVHWF